MPAAESLSLHVPQIITTSDQLPIRIELRETPLSGEAASERICHHTDELREIVAVSQSNIVSTVVMAWENVAAIRFPQSAHVLAGSEVLGFAESGGGAPKERSASQLRCATL